MTDKEYFNISSMIPCTFPGQFLERYFNMLPFIYLELQTAEST